MNVTMVTAILVNRIYRMYILNTLGNLQVYLKTPGVCPYSCHWVLSDQGDSQGLTLSAVHCCEHWYHQWMRLGYWILDFHLMQYAELSSLPDHPPSKTNFYLLVLLTIITLSKLYYCRMKVETKLLHHMMFYWVSTVWSIKVIVYVILIIITDTLTNDKTVSMTQGKSKLIDYQECKETNTDTLTV